MLIQIFNKTLIEILVENLKRYGAKEVNIILGYKKELILKKLRQLKVLNLIPLSLKIMTKMDME